MRDLRYAARLLAKSPVFAAVAILTLGLGVGANSAIFSLVNAVLLRPFPFPEPDRLVFVWEETAMFGLKDSVVAMGNFTEWRARNRVFEQMGALEQRRYLVTGAGEPLQIRGSIVTAGLFRTLGVQPALGRLFREEEDQPGTARVAILSDGFWHRAFGGDPAILGRNFFLNEEKYDIVGVMPPGFRFPDSANELWAPTGTGYEPADLTNKGRHDSIVVARLAPGIPVRRANEDIRAIASQMQREYPETNRSVSAFVAPMRDHFVGETRPALLMLLAAVGFVLLIACANIANLLLARATVRRREMAVRAALGAGRCQIVRQLLTENILLALCGGALGLGIAGSSLHFLESLVPSGIAGLAALEVDLRVLGFTLAVSLLTGMICGLVPGLQALRLDLHQVLKQRGVRSATGSRKLQRALVIAEVALAFVLTVGAGLMIQTLSRVRSVDVGFRTDHLLSARMAPATRKYEEPAKRMAFYQGILQRVTALPGVVSAGFSNGVPIAFKGWVNGFTIEGQPPLGGDVLTNANYRVVTPDYLRTLGVPLLEGRSISDSDTAGSPPVVLINESMKRRFWPGERVLGKRLRFSNETPWITVAGVVGDIHQAGLDTAPKAELYVPAAQAPILATWLALRTRGSPAQVAAAVRAAVREVEPDSPVPEMSSMEDIIDREVAQRRVHSTLLAVFALLALLLASLGVYGVLAYLVGQRTQEIGIRIALGATPAEVLQSVLGQGVALGAAGIGIGALVALGATRMLSRLLFGIAPTDPLTFISVGSLLLVTAAAASCVPALRAMKVDPIQALREE